MLAGGGHGCGQVPQAWRENRKGVKKELCRPRLLPDVRFHVRTNSSPFFFVVFFPGGERSLRAGYALSALAQRSPKGCRKLRGSEGRACTALARSGQTSSKTRRGNLTQRQRPLVFRKNRRQDPHANGRERESSEGAITCASSPRAAGSDPWRRAESLRSRERGSAPQRREALGRVRSGCKPSALFDWVYGFRFFGLSPSYLGTPSFL